MSFNSTSLTIFDATCTYCDGGCYYANDWSLIYEFVLNSYYLVLLNTNDGGLWFYFLIIILDVGCGRLDHKISNEH